MMIARARSDLRTSLLTLLLAMLVATASVGFGQYRLAQAQREYLAAQQQLSAAHHRLAANRNDQLVLPAYAALYRHLQYTQMISATPPDLRPQLERLRPLVLDMHYTLSAPHPYPAHQVSHFALTQSPVHLQLELLHEERLLDFLDGLRATGWFMLERCALEPTDSALHADCSGSWLTVSSDANH